MPRAGLVAGIGCLALAAFLARRFLAAQWVLWASCGFLFCAAHACIHLQHVWPTAAADERVRAIALIDSIPEPRGEDWAFDALVHIEAPQPRSSALRVRMISRDSSVRPHAGERWQLLIALRPPRAAVNPGAVDRERLLFHDRIHALGTVVSSRQNERIDEGHRPLTALRERIALHIFERVADRDAAGLIAALAVGATGGMSREQWRVFNATGTTHLVAISGLHVTLFAVVMLAFARHAWSLFAWRWAHCNRETFAAVFGLLAATAYATLAGLSIPTQRTLIMLAAWLLTRCMARNAPPWQPFAIALLAVLLLDPFAPLAAGFWLSFGAMGAILLVTGARFTRRSVLREAIAVQLAVAVALVPLTLLSFGSISIIGPLVNVLAIPYMSWLLVPVVLLGVMLLPVWESAATAAFRLAEWLHDLGWPWLAGAADSPVALAYASPPSWWYLLAAASVPLAFAPWPARLRIAVALCVLPLMAAGSGSPQPGALEMTVLEVGEGMAVVLRTARHVLLYGTGESYGTAGSRAETVVVPFLRSRGVTLVDRLVVERLTPITGEGVTALLAALPVTTTSVGGTAPADFAGAKPCKAGEAWSWDEVRFRILEGCQLEVTAARDRALLGSGVVRISRVGAVVSRGAAEGGIDAGDPRDTAWSVLSGQASRHGKPRPAFTSLASPDTQVLATADAGAIRIVLPGRAGATLLERQRDAHAALWRSAAAEAPTLK